MVLKEISIYNINKMNSELEYIRSIEAKKAYKCEELIECPYCNTCYMRHTFHVHERSQKHKRNVERVQQIISYVHQSTNY